MLTKLLLLLLSPCLLFGSLMFPCPEGCGKDDDPTYRAIAREITDLFSQLLLGRRDDPRSAGKGLHGISVDRDNYHFISVNEYGKPINGWRCYTRLKNPDSNTLLKVTIYQLQDPNEHFFYKRYITLLRSYHEFAYLWKLLERDVYFRCDYFIREYQYRMQRHQSILESKCLRSERHRDDLKMYEAALAREQDLFARWKQLLRTKKAALDGLYNEMHTYCAQNHGFAGAEYQAGVLYFDQGHADAAISSIGPLIEKILKDESRYLAEVIKLKDQKDAHPGDTTPLKELLSELHQIKGESHAELDQFNEAIISLTKAIEHDPKKKEVYLERASAYFETGDFTKSLEDFLHAEVKTNQLLSHQLEFASGLILGIHHGLEESMSGFIGSAKGLGHGLWALVCDPVDCSKELVDALRICILRVKNSTSKELFKVIAPELYELATHWDSLTDNNRGLLAGTVVGKYGVEIFATYGITKGIKAYRDLSRANKTLTLERAASNPQAAAKLQQAAERCAASNFTSQEMREKAVDAVKKWGGQQGERLLAEVEVREVLHQYGFRTFERPKGIPENWEIGVAKGGIIYHQPKNKHNSIRVMDANPFARFSSQKRPYVMRMKDGKPLDKKGTRLTTDKCPEAHISLEEFVFKE